MPRQELEPRGSVRFGFNLGHSEMRKKIYCFSSPGPCPDVALGEGGFFFRSSALGRRPALAPAAGWLGHGWDVACQRRVKVASSRSEAPRRTLPKERLPLQKRVSYQRAIEDVYLASPGFWPKDNHTNPRAASRCRRSSPPGRRLEKESSQDYLREFAGAGGLLAPADYC